MSLELGKTTWTTAFDPDEKRAKGAKMRRKKERIGGGQQLSEGRG